MPTEKAGVPAPDPAARAPLAAPATYARGAAAAAPARVAVGGVRVPAAVALLLHAPLLPRPHTARPRAQPTAARRPAPPAPTTTTSYWWSTMLYAGAVARAVASAPTSVDSPRACAMPPSIVSRQCPAVASAMGGGGASERGGARGLRGAGRRGTYT